MWGGGTEDGVEEEGVVRGVSAGGHVNFFVLMLMVLELVLIPP